MLEIIRNLEFAEDLIARKKYTKLNNRYYFTERTKLRRLNISLKEEHCLISGILESNKELR